MEARQEYVFDSFRVVPAHHQVLRENSPVDLGGRAFDVLVALIERSDRIVTRDELMHAVWPGVTVEENNLTVAISAVRKALGCGVDGRRFIVTVTGRGYRFVAPVEPVGTAPGTAQAPAASPGIDTNLPSILSSLVGREAEIARIRSLLEANRLVSIVGTGGIGKTRAAIAAAEQCLEAFSDGIWLIELADLNSPQLVPETIAAQFGIGLRDGGADAIATYLQRKTILLVLDSCEHLIEEVTRVVEAVLKKARFARILTTSREPLRVPGEMVYRLPPLRLPDAVENLTAEAALGYDSIALFVDRVRLTDDAFTLTDESVRAVGELVTHLDGIPLAIELAARRLEVLSPEDLLRRLSDRFAVLNAGNRTAVPRHQTLKAALDWSYALLSEEARILLRRLAVFGGSFTIEAASAVAAEPELSPCQILTLLAELVDKSLVTVLSTSSGRRYRLLESIRQYGLECLQAAGEGDRRSNLAAHLTTLFKEADKAWAYEPNEVLMQRYAPELDNLRSALSWAFASDEGRQAGIVLLSYTDPYWRELCLTAERRRWFERANELIDDSTPLDALARIMLGLAFTGALGQRRNVGHALEAVGIFRQLGEPLHLGRALHAAAAALVQHGDAAEATSYAEEAEQVLRGLGPSKALAAVLDTIGSIRFMDGDRRTARRYAEESLALATQLGLQRGIELTTLNLAEHDFGMGDIDGAIERGRAALAACRKSGNKTNLSYALTNLAAYLAIKGEIKSAQEAACEGLRLNLLFGHEQMVVSCVEHLALCAARQGQGEIAARLTGYSDAFYAAREQTRQVTEQTVRDAIEGLVVAGLDPVRRATLRAEGATWEPEHAQTAALKAGALGPHAGSPEPRQPRLTVAAAQG